MHKKSILLIFAALTLTGGLLSGCSNQNSQEQTLTDTSAVSGSNASSVASVAASTPAVTNTITVNSSEKVSVIPDIATVVYSVQTKAKEAADCQQKNAESVNQVIALLKRLNIQESSIQTSNYYMNPTYNYSGSTPVLTGYEANTSLTVSDLPIDGLSDILTQSVATGINSVQSVSYEASGYDNGYQQALKTAVSSALDKATILAEAAGCTVGKVVSIQETSAYAQTRYTDNALTGNLYHAKEELMSMDSSQMMPGEIAVEASITVEYELK